MALTLAACALSISTLAIGPGVAHAGTGCTALVGTEPLTLGVVGREVHVPGVKARWCRTDSGDGTVTHAPQWVTPRLQPGTCEPSAFDAACFSVYIDTANLFQWQNWTLETYVDGVPQDPVSVDFPQHFMTGGSLCVLSVGYRVAPTHDCLSYLDLGQ